MLAPILIRVLIFLIFNKLISQFFQYHSFYIVVVN